MKTAEPNFATFLLNRGCLSAAQLDEAVRLQQRDGCRLADALLRLGYAGMKEILQAIAESYGITFVDLTEVVVPPAVVELVPEAVARECRILPLACDRKSLTVAVGDPSDSDTITKLQFILNRDVAIVLAPPEQIIEAINRHYGQTETESVDSMLQEFTDTQIDFTETTARPWAPDLHTPAEKSPVPSARTVNREALEDEDAGCLCEAGLEDERQATVRYYHRMNPEKMFPLLVVLSPGRIVEVVQSGVSQNSSQRFKVEAGSFVEVEPILPGCSCYPPRDQLRVFPGQAECRFWVVPHVLGKVMQARVVLRQKGEVLAEVPLEMRVVKQTMTLVMAGLTCLLPLVAAVMQHFGIDLRERLQDGLYSRLTGLLLGTFSPDMLALLLLGLTCGLYLWLRPRKRDQFWDVLAAPPESSREPTPERNKAGTVVTEAEPSVSQAAFLSEAGRHYRQRQYREALALYREALAMGKAPAEAYARAALAAGRLQKNALALTILQEATEKLPASAITAAMWYNMGCFAARLGLVKDAMRYLNRAVDAGYTNVRKFHADPDLNRLRDTREFKTLLACLDS
jgi:hypothetical protein